MQEAIGLFEIVGNGKKKSSSLFTPHECDLFPEECLF